MKKNYLMMMAMLLFAAIGFTGCSDDNGDDDGDFKTLLVGTWDLTSAVGYERISSGETYEWDESTYGGDYHLTFNEDGTGDENGDKFTWSVSGNSLVTTDSDDGENTVYTIRTLTTTTLVLYFSEDTGDGFYVEETCTYTKR